jgi:uncharacterized protein
VITVSNTSPLITLAAIGKLELLEQIYQQIVIPQAVHDEIAQGATRPGTAYILSRPWLNIRGIQDTARVANLQQNLHRGEAEAIALALEMQSSVLLIDEQRGRRIATILGIPVTGVIGTLIAAKHAGLIPQVKPILNDMVRLSGFRINQRLYTQVLHQVGEVAPAS